MPRKTEWIHRIPHALEVLRQSGADLVDRKDVEDLLDVSPRQAIRILNQLGAAEAGKNLFIDREQMIARLQRVQEGDDVRYERRRLQRLETTLSKLGQDLRARKIKVEATPAARDLLFPSLPACVRIQPGRLEIDFRDAEDLLTRLFELSQAIANDYDRFQAACATVIPTSNRSDI